MTSVRFRPGFGSVALLAVTLAGCAEQRQAQEDQKAYDAWLTTSARDRGMEEGVISQSTLYSYHFERDGERLNSLGASIETFRDI